jgi:hypothetical protein
LQPFVVMAPAVQTTVAGPHSLEAVTLASQLGSVEGLQPRLVVPVVQFAKTGGVATCQVKVRVQVVTGPQSVTGVSVKTCVRLQPLTVMGPAVQPNTVMAPQSLEAVTCPPNAGWKRTAQLGSVAGLQPRSMVLSQLVKTMGDVDTFQL